MRIADLMPKLLAEITGELGTLMAALDPEAVAGFDRVRPRRTSQRRLAH